MTHNLQKVAAKPRKFGRRPVLEHEHTPNDQTARNRFRVGCSFVDVIFRDRGFQESAQPIAFHSVFLIPDSCIVIRSQNREWLTFVRFDPMPAQNKRDECRYDTHAEKAESPSVLEGLCNYLHHQ